MNSALIPIIRKTILSTYGLVLPILVVLLRHTSRVRENIHCGFHKSVTLKVGLSQDLAIKRRDPSNCDTRSLSEPLQKLALGVSF
jgi:hypothetical protein